MAHLPLLTDAEEAIDYYKSQPHSPSDPITAHVIRILVQDGYKNRDIREALGIEKVYTVTHFIRVSQALTDGEMELWFNNPDRTGRRSCTWWPVRPVRNWWHWPASCVQT